MLVLTRREEESILIKVGEITIQVLVVELGRDKVRLGITAPKEVAIERDDCRVRGQRSEVGGQQSGAGAALHVPATADEEDRGAALARGARDPQGGGLA
jgi:carbon storage regulator CsrA